MDKCEGCPMNMHLDFPEAGGCGRIDCYLIPSDFTAIKAAIAGEGRLVCIQGDELPKMQDFFREGFSDGYKKGAEDGINQLKTFVEGLLERQDQGGE